MVDIKDLKTWVECHYCDIDLDYDPEDIRRDETGDIKKYIICPICGNKVNVGSDRYYTRLIGGDYNDEI